jgi:hypothetical protein
MSYHSLGARDAFQLHAVYPSAVEGSAPDVTSAATAGGPTAF